MWYLKSSVIGLDKSGYQVNIFLLSPRKHTHNICFRGKIRKILILLDSKKASMLYVEDFYTTTIFSFLQIGCFN